MIQHTCTSSAANRRQRPVDYARHMQGTLSHPNMTSRNIQWRTVALQWRHIERVAGSVSHAFNNRHVGALARSAVTETILQPRASS